MQFNAKQAVMAAAFATALTLTAAPAKAVDTTFNATMSILTALTVAKNADLAFGNYEAGIATVVTVAPGSAGVANFDITAGAATTAVTISVVEPSINMITGAGALPSEQIPVNNWTFGGVGVTDLGGGTGSLTTDALGQFTGIEVGGDATLDGTDVVGAYSGSATFRVVYQ